MQPMVSVISPMYNVAAYVGECIESLKRQRFGDFEAVFVDDGSTDGSYEVAVAAAGSDERFRFLRQDNAGQSVARNRALDVANGTYVLFLDSDDAYVPETLERTMGACAEDDLDAALFNARMQYDTHDLVATNEVSYFDRTGPKGVVSGYEMLVETSANGSFRSSACMYAVRRSILEEHRLRFRPGIIHEDHLFTLLLFEHLGRCRFLPEALYVRRMRHGSTMTKTRGMRNVKGLFTVSCELERHLYERAEHWPADYVDAYAHELHETWGIIAHDARNVGAEELREYRKTLNPAERAAFDLHVVEAGAYLAETEESFTGSTTYRVGRAIMTVPILLKERLKRAPK